MAEFQKFLTELYTVSYLIFFALFGTLCATRDSMGHILSWYTDGDTGDMGQFRRLSNYGLLS